VFQQGNGAEDSTLKYGEALERRWGAFA